MSNEVQGIQRSKRSAVWQAEGRCSTAVSLEECMAEGPAAGSTHALAHEAQAPCTTSFLWKSFLPSSGFLQLLPATLHLTVSPPPSPAQLCSLLRRQLLAQVADEHAARRGGVGDAVERGVGGQLHERALVPPQLRQRDLRRGGNKGTAPAALLTGGRCRPQRPWGSSSLPPYRRAQLQASCPFQVGRLAYRRRHAQA